MERVKTGITGLDEVIGGGIPQGFVVAVTGGPGSGKSILATQFVWQGIQQGEDVLYILLSGEANEIVAQASQFGWKLEGNPKFHLYIQGAGDTDKLTDQIRKQIGEYNIKRVVIDSISLFNVYRRAQRETVDAVLKFQPDAIASKDNRVVISELRGMKEITTIVLVEEYEGMPIEDKISKFACDGVIQVSINPSINLRQITIQKMRETKHYLSALTFEILASGLDVKPPKK